MKIWSRRIAQNMNEKIRKNVPILAINFVIPNLSILISIVKSTEKLL